MGFPMGTLRAYTEAARTGGIPDLAPTPTGPVPLPHLRAAAGHGKAVIMDPALDPGLDHLVQIPGHERDERYPAGGDKSLHGPRYGPADRVHPEPARHSTFAPRSSAGMVSSLSLRIRPASTSTTRSCRATSKTGAILLFQKGNAVFMRSLLSIRPGIQHRSCHGHDIVFATANMPEILFS